MTCIVSEHSDGKTFFKVESVTHPRTKPLQIAPTSKKQGEAISIWQVDYTLSVAEAPLYHHIQKTVSIMGTTTNDDGRTTLRRGAIFVVALLFMSLPSVYYTSLVSHDMGVLKELKGLSTADIFGHDNVGQSNGHAVAKVGGDPDALSFAFTNSTHKPLITVVVCTKSKNDWKNVSQTSLHTLLLPSMENTVSLRELKKFRVEVVVAFDTGDTFWEKATNRQELADETIFPISFLSIPKDPARPHHIPFNQLCRAAYEYGAEYIVRLNDDTEFLTTHWITQSVDQLAKFNPPNLGVVGPRCDEGNTAILTHDFVHRTHLDIFNDYYPDEFDNWWIDDWITYVYGSSRTTKIYQFHVRHHTGKHGTRYEVNASQQRLVKTVIARGKKSIELFLQNHTGEPKTYKVLGTDRVNGVWGPMDRAAQ